MARKKAKLGIQLGTTPHCYAAILGGDVGPCDSKVSMEHPLSAVLRRGQTLTIEIGTASSTLSPSFKSTMSIEHLKAPILCVTHNNGLSDVDSEALAFQDALIEMKALHRSGLVAPGSIRRIDGRRFGRWLCKYYCGAIAMQNKTPQLDLVRYAFGLPTERRVRFYCPAKIGAQQEPGILRNMPLITLPNGLGIDQGFLVWFDGLPFLVTLYDANAPEMVDVVKNYEGSELVDRLAGIVSGNEGFKIDLIWDDAAP